MKKCNNAKKLAYLFGILILALVCLVGGLRILEPAVSFSGENQGAAIERKTITRNGVNYFPRQDITVLMILGVDYAGSAQDSGDYRNPGMADLVALVIFDEKAQMYDVLYLNRDTMLDVPVLGMDGEQAGSIYGQLALAHSYGSGLEDSCENTVKAVSDFLDGIRIDYYVSLHMDAIAMLNNAVGGVRVLVEDVFSKVDPHIVSNCPVNTLYSMISRYEDYELRELVTPEGENVRGAEYYEFYADEEKLDELILRLFYAPK